MKRALLIAVALFLFAHPSFSAVTTTDGLITLDFYEDTQLGVDNLWILDFTVNDIDGAGGVEEISFELTFLNTVMDFNNQYNTDTDYYVTGYSSSGTIPLLLLPYIATPQNATLTPVTESFTFFSTPLVEGTPIIDEFYIKLSYGDNLGNNYHENIQLTGPVGFVPVPEPVGISLFLFGAFLLKYLTKKVF
ncbi:MAG: hypothetical protein RBU23_03450 [Candidatus Auribacterota bacterium]|jgi:hypothetical protein|nr:hypothetical protein [Candidatus Auribacterota bacterium]